MKNDIVFGLFVLLIIVAILIGVPWLGWVYRYGAEFNIKVMSFALSALLFPAGFLAYLRLRKELIIRPELNLWFYLEDTNERVDKLINPKTSVVGNHFGEGRPAAGLRFRLHIFNSGKSPSHDYRILFVALNEGVDLNASDGWSSDILSGGIEWYKYERNHDFKAVYPNQFIPLKPFNVFFPWDSSQGGPKAGTYKFEYEIQSIGRAESEQGELQIIL